MTFRRRACAERAKLLIAHNGSRLDAARFLCSIPACRSGCNTVFIEHVYILTSFISANEKEQ